MTGGVNICHVNRASSNVAHPPLYLVRLLEIITVRGISGQLGLIVYRSGTRLVLQNGSKGRMIKWLTFPVTQPTTSGNCQQKHLVNAIIIDPWPSLANSRLEKLPQMQNGSVQETEEDQRQTHGSINYYCLNSYNVQNISVENSHNNIPVTRLSFFPSTSASVTGIY